MDPRLLVGRHDELGRVEDFLDRSARGPATLLLSGPAGIGKSTLWNAALDAAARRGFTVLRTRPAEADARLAYAGLADLVSPTLDDIAPTLPRPQAHALGVAVRRLDPLDSPAEPLAVSLGMLAALKVISDRAPTIVAVDDVPWLDGSTLQVLQFAVRRLTTERVGLLLAHRTQAADDAGPQTIRDLASHAERIAVAPMSADEVEALIRGHLGATFRRPALLQITRQSGGNPFFALEIASALLRRGLDTGAPESTIPDDLAALVADRLSALSVDGQEVALAAALMARPTIDLLRSSLGPGVAAAGLAETTRQRVAIAVGNDVQFLHPLLASAAVRHAGEDRRRAMHRRLARLIPDPEESARHMALASDRPGHALAEALDRAAALARGRGAPDAAIDLALLARRHTPERDADGIRRRTMAIAEYSILAGDPQQARLLLEAELERTPPGVARSEVLVLLADARSADDWKARAQLLEAAVVEAGESPAHRAAAEHALAGTDVIVMSDRPGALVHARLALKLNERLGDPVRIALSLAQVALFDHQVRGRYRADLWKRAIAIAPTPWPGRLLFAPQYPQAICLALAGDLRLSRGQLTTIRDEAERMGDWDTLPLALVELSLIELLLGDWGPAVGHAAEAEVVAHQTGQSWARAWLLGVRSLIGAHLGHDAAVRADAAEALAVAKGIGVWSLPAATALGLLELSLGRNAEAHQWLESVSEVHLRAGIGEPSTMRTVAFDVEALIRLGRIEEAETALLGYERLAAATKHGWAVAVAARCRGMLLAATGRLAEGIETLGRAVAAHERVQEPFERARTILVLGETQRRARRRGVAHESIASALATFEDLGASIWASRARSELARTGLDARRTGALSETQEAIARLVASGRTNREVAEALFMSPHTVDTHLRTIYRVLGVRSRTELAGLVRGAPRPEA